MANETGLDGTRLSNQRRAAARKRCRQLLADHLGSRLGLVVDPEVVRLIPNPDDGYIWVRQPEREHLFMKQLSKHSYGAYVELCREIGISFEATLKPESERKDTNADATTSIMSLRSSINELKGENEELKKELAHGLEKAQAEGLARRHAEHRYSELKNELYTERIKQDLLAQKNVQLTSTMKRLRTRLNRANHGVKLAMSTLQQLNPGAIREDSDATMANTVDE